MNTKEALLNIKLELKRQGKTQRELAKHLGHTDVSISYILSGRNKMKLDMFLKIAAWLNVAASDLLKNNQLEAMAA